MEHSYSILQIKNHSSLKNFADYRWLTERLGGFDIADYETVYSGKITGTDTEMILEDLFYAFNMDHPSDFRGHSLSVSDVVALDGELWYCDSFGWKKIQ